MVRKRRTPEGVVEAPSDALMALLLDGLEPDMPWPVATTSANRCVIDLGTGNTLEFVWGSENGRAGLMIQVRFATEAADDVRTALVSEADQGSAGPRPGEWTAQNGMLFYDEFVAAESLADPDPEATALRTVSLRRRIAASTAHAQRLVFDAEHPAH